MQRFSVKLEQDILSKKNIVFDSNESRYMKEVDGSFYYVTRYELALLIVAHLIELDDESVSEDSDIKKMVDSVVDAIFKAALEVYK